MKRTLITAVALVACMGTELFAQNTKEGALTFALTYQRQDNVTTVKGQKYAGKWSQRPAFYTSKQNQKLSTKNILQDISYVMHGKNPNYYSSKAQLVFVQGELGGFFNVNEELWDAEQAEHLAESGTNVVAEPSPGQFYPNGLDSTIEGVNVRLAMGRHFQPAPDVDENDDPLPESFVGGWPPGHHQPWGQIFVKDTGKSPILCENVTFFFAITVEECYDCFYLSSFITDATFKIKDAQTVIDGPPCCGGTVPAGLTGNGKDRYYMTLSFDNTQNNPYLNNGFPDFWIGWGQRNNPDLPAYNPYAGIIGINPFPPTGLVDGITPDALPYVDKIASQLGVFNPYVLRFTLNGIVTYTWNLKLINSNDLIPDFIGKATYGNVSGYGFWGLYCSLFTGSASIAEKALKTSTCCLDLPWNDSWYGPGYDAIGNSSLRETPVNIQPSLSYHQYWNVGYVPGEQSGSAPLTDEPTGPESAAD